MDNEDIGSEIVNHIPVRLHATFLAEITESNSDTTKWGLHSM